jgi:hypothetical protein
MARSSLRLYIYISWYSTPQTNLTFLTAPSLSPDQETRQQQKQCKPCCHRCDDWDEFLGLGLGCLWRWRGSVTVDLNAGKLWNSCGIGKMHPNKAKIDSKYMLVLVGSALTKSIFLTSTGSSNTYFVWRERISYMQSQQQGASYKIAYA